MGEVMEISSECNCWWVGGTEWKCRNV